MGRKELEELLNQLQSKNSNALLIPSDEKSSAARLDAAEIAAQNIALSQMTHGDKMAKMSVQELDEHRSRNRMKVRKVPQGALALVTPATVTAPKSSPVEFSEVTTPIRQPAPFIAPAPSPTRMQRLLRWLFAPPAAPTTSVDLVQLRRDIREWTALQIKIDRLRNAERNFRIRSEIARYIFLIITAACYVLLACAAIRI
jgi:hypothetical protein